MGQEMTAPKKDWMTGWSNIENDVADALPTNMPVERFKSVAKRAVQQNADLLTVDDKKSLFLSCLSAAQDGLMPDGREGALVIFNKKQGNNWISGVQWMPMIGGIRKRLANVGFDLRANVVYEHDEFDYQLGDKEHVFHRPAALNEDRGDMIGAYAIATDVATGQKYHEVMDKAAIAKVRACAKGADSPHSPWNKWTEEQWRKTVAKKLSKSLPIGDMPPEKQDFVDRFHGTIQHDNEMYEPGEGVTMTSDTASKAQEAARARRPKNVTPMQYEPDPPQQAQPKSNDGPTPAPPIEGELDDSGGDGGDFDGTEPDF